MQRQANIWTGTLPFILAPALFLGLFWSPTEVRAQTPQTETLEGAEGSSVVTLPGVGAEMPGYTSDATGNVAAKAVRSKTKAIKPAAAQSADPEKPVEGIGTPAAARKQYGGKLVSLDLMDADLKNVLRLLADLTGTNIVIEPDVSGKVTLKVEQVPWDQVLDMVLSMNDLGKEQVGNVIRIARQAKLRQEYLQQVEAIKAKQSLAETTRDLGDILTVYFPVNFGKPAELAAKISDSKSERGKISVDERTSVIIYSDYPARVAAARQLLTRLDRPTPQVLIEARIVTLNSEVKRNLGFNLSFQTQQPIPAGSVNSQQFQINPPLSALNQLGLTINSLVGKTLINVDLQIQALQQINQLRIVAAPRVMTLDNVKAVVSQGTEVPYLTVGDTAANITAVSFKDAVLELAVTPHITPDRKVRMLINAKQDSVSSTIYNIGNSSEPGIDTRKIQTELLVDDGNVVAIGGVINNQSTVTKSSTPGLADIPILGRLFKIDSSDDQRNELLIFISPKIVEVSRPYDKS
ncbi:MAG TPA: type IV pilus secretin PilQ [Syntrophobacteraceae bacterium]|nr:type IV pilus secretin PilQ [Syntrophobacteraceae bacterium]